MPISLLGTSPNLMLAKHDVAKSMLDFIAKAKAAPGKFNYSTPGIGTKGHFAVELLKLRAGIDLVHVPYPSGGQVVQSLFTGTTQLGSTALPAGEPHVIPARSPASRSAAQKRWRTLPEVPTLIELGYADLVAEIFTALVAPAGTPPEIVALLVAEVGKLVKDPAVVEKAERAGYEWIGAGPDALAQGDGGGGRAVAGSDQERGADAAVAKRRYRVSGIGAVVVRTCLTQPPAARCSRA